ncbi:MAG: glycine--tRNA ligase subunit beta [Halanaerobiaceae bacterium]
MARDLLLEVGTEEMPADFMAPVRKDFLEIIKNLFDKNRLTYKDCHVYSTPRRLVLYVSGLVEIQNDKKEVVRGPAREIAFDEKGEPTKAALGFSRGQGMEVDELIERDGYLYDEKMIEGKKTGEILPAIIVRALKDINFPKSMRWGDLDLRFIRPIRWLVFLFGREQLNINLGGVDSGRVSYGHRFLSNSPINIDGADKYFDLLREEFVIVDQTRRKELILDQIEELDIKGGSAVINPELLQEVTELVEFPTAFYGEFSDEFLELPEEVLITSMQEHQRYFPVVDDNHDLLSYFIGIRDGSEKYIEEVIHGNEMVLRARLADARFFFEADREVSFEERQEKLKEIVYQEKLGSMFEKVMRVKKLALRIGKGLKLNDEQLEIIERAAELCKNDLVTEMVNEFAKLQGVMGREYALLNGEKEEVAAAIFEHYQPRNADDSLPSTEYGQILSIADKLETITGHFSIGMIPTGSQDPFALRRQSTGIVKIIMEKDLNLKLSNIINWSMSLFNKEEKNLFQKIKDFLLQRLINILEERNIRYDIINAVVAVNNDNINDLLKRAEAVMDIREEDPVLFEKLVHGLLRARNLAAEGNCSPELNVDLLQVGVEKELYRKFKELKELIINSFVQKKYRRGLKYLVKLKEPIDNYLDNTVVMVEDEEIRKNRLTLLQNISSILEPVMDIETITLD